MKTKNIVFNGMILIVGESKANYDLFHSVLSQGRYTEFMDCVYNIEFMQNKLFIEIEYGHPLPRRDYVINQDTKEKEDNRRGENQFEPKICYCVIDFTKSYLWISNLKQKKNIKEFLVKTLGVDTVVLKDVYNEEEFLKLLYTLDELKFSGEPNLLSATESLSASLSNMCYFTFVSLLCWR